MKKIVFALMFLFSTIDGARAANVTAQVNRTDVPAGEVFILSLKSDEHTNEKPDLSALKGNFDIFSNSVSRKSYHINGKTEASTEWKIALMPLQEGKVQIPPIKIGNDQTNPVDLNVLPQGSVLPVDQNLPSENKQKYQIRTEIEDFDHEPYVQQQILYQVIVTDFGGLQSGEPVFENNADFLIKSLGDPKVEFTDNQRQIVYTYALFPQKSGHLKIPDVVFKGEIAAEADSDPFQNIFENSLMSVSLNMPSIFQARQPIRLKATGKEITVLPVFKDYPSNWWLPAQEVKMNAVFKDRKKTDSNDVLDLPQEYIFIQGEPIKREITLTAVGVIDTQLPQIIFPSSEDLKQYPEKSTGENMLRDGKLIALEKVTNVYVPEKSGKVILPEISVYWFNVKTRKIEKSVIEAMEINVRENPDALLKTQSRDFDNTVEEIERETPSNPTQTNTGSKSDRAFYAAVFSAFLIGLILSALFFKRRKKYNPDIKPYCETRQYPDFIIDKAYQNDFRSLRDALISWATGFYPEKSVTNLKDIAVASENEEFSKQIDIILKKLYSENASDYDFNPKVFTDLFKQIQKKKKAQNKKNILPPLYE